MSLTLSHLFLPVVMSVCLVYDIESGMFSDYVGSN